MYLVTSVLQPRMDPCTPSSGTQIVQSSVSSTAVSLTAWSVQGAYIAQLVVDGAYINTISNIGSIH